MNWIVLSIIALIGQGLVLFIVKFLSININPLVLLAYQYAGSLLLASIYLWFKGINFKPTTKELSLLLLSGFLVSTGLAFYYTALSMASASQVVPIHNIGVTLLPVFFGLVLIKERLTKRLVLGLLFSIIGIVLLSL